MAAPMANRVLTDAGQPSCMAVPRARLTALRISHRKNWCSQSCMDDLSIHIKTDCWTSFAGSTGFPYSINPMHFYMRGTCGNLSVNLNSCVRMHPALFFCAVPVSGVERCSFLEFSSPQKTLRGKKG